MSDHGTHTPTHPPARPRYRGSSAANPRRGTARAPRAVPGHVCGHQCRSVSPTLLAALGGPDAACRRLCRIHLDLGDNPTGGIAYWAGEQVWVEIDVADAYQRRYYTNVRPVLRATRGGGVSLRAVQAVARAMATAADRNTGHNSRLSLATLCDRTALSRSTVQRARQALRLLGVATEILRGRQRTRTERLASWRVGDHARGWASVWTLHPAHPVDKTRIIIAGQTEMAPHPRRGHLLSCPSRREKLTTAKTCGKRAAARPGPDKRGRRRGAVPDPQGAILASRWLRDPRTPPWARRHGATAWARVLAEPAEHGWTPADLNDTLDTWAQATGITPTPTTPLAFLRWLLARQDLPYPPHVLDEIARAQELAERQQRQAQAAAALTLARHQRHAGAAARGGPGHQAALAAARTAAHNARRRKTTTTAHDAEIRRTQVQQRRTAHHPHPGKNESTPNGNT